MAFAKPNFLQVAEGEEEREGGGGGESTAASVELVYRHFPIRDEK